LFLSEPRSLAAICISNHRVHALFIIPWHVVLDVKKLEALHRMTLKWCERLGLPRINPATGQPSADTPKSLA
jgi:hypothetical protein